MLNYKFFCLFRFVLALMVVVSHFAIFLPENLMLEFRYVGLGNMAVMTFFILSGFVMAESNNIFYKDRTDKFLINRFLRIIPPYFIALLISIGVHYFLFMSSEQILLNTISQYLDYTNSSINIFSIENIGYNFLNLIIWHGLGILGFTYDYTFVRYIWAVIIEVKFYIVIAVMYYLSDNKRLTNIPYLFLILFFGLFLFFMFSQIQFLYSFGFTPYFVFGMTMYYLVIKASRQVIFLSIFSLVFLVWHFYIYISASDGYHLLSISILLLLLIMIFLFLIKNTIPISKKVDKFFGDLSYSLYLNHFIIQVVFLYFDLKGWKIFVIGIGIAFVLSYLLNIFVEPITNQIRNKVRGIKI